MSGRFVILAAPRTGSNLLCTLLDSHPQVLCHHELFNPNGVFYALSQRRRDLEPESLAVRDADPLTFLRQVWEHSRGHAWVGFKFTRDQCPVVLEHVLKNPEVRVILLRRRNRIKTLVSEVIARHTDQWEVYAGEDLVADRPQVHVDYETLQRHVATNQRFYDRIVSSLAGHGKEYLAVDYEDLFSVPVQARLLAHLGVPEPAAPLTAASVKQNPRDLRQLIANFSQLDLVLKDTPFHGELHDRGN